MEQSDGTRKRKTSASVKGPLQKKASRQISRASAKGLAGPVMKKKRSIDFIQRYSEPLESRIRPQQSRFKRLWRFLTDGLIKPVKTTEEEDFLYELRSFTMNCLLFILVVVTIYKTDFSLVSSYNAIIASDLILDSMFESEYLGSSMRFKEINNPEHIWEYIKAVLLKIIYPKETTNNTHNSILDDNAMFGVAQIRQVRVRKDTCLTPPLFQTLFKHCYGYYSERDEDKEPFGLNDSLPWKYSYNRNKPTSGLISRYGGHGYAMNFTRDYNLTKLWLDELERNNWIRLGTRAVMIDFTMYSANADNFLVVNLVFEMLPIGGVFPSSKIYTFNLLKSFHDAKGYAVIAQKVFLLMYAIGMNLVLFVKVKKYGAKKILNCRTVVDVAIILLVYLSAVMASVTRKSSHRLILPLIEMFQESQHPSFGPVNRNIDAYLTLATALLACVSLKFIFYIHFFNQTATLAGCTLLRVRGELLCFTIMTFAILFGFSNMFCVLYGHVNRQLATPFNALVHIVSLYVRPVRINVRTQRSLSAHHVALGYIISALVRFFIFFVSIPTYTALIVHGWYYALRECQGNKPLRITAYDVPLIRIIQVLSHLNLYTWANRVQEFHIIKMNVDDYFSFTHILRRYGWTPLEIRLMLKKYGIRKGDDLHMEELLEVYQDFWTRNLLALEVGGHEALKKELNAIKKNMDYYESMLSDMKTKIERLMDDVIGARTVPPKAPRRSTIISYGPFHW